MNNAKKILFGDFWTLSFFKKDLNFKVYIMLLLAAYLIFISLIPTYQKKIEKQKEINEGLKQKSIYYSSKLMQISLESQILEEINKRNIDLQKLKQPPMVIIVEKDD